LYAKNIFNFHISGKLLNKKCYVCFIHTVLINSTIENELRQKTCRSQAFHMFCSTYAVYCVVLSVETGVYGKQNVF